MEITKLAPTLDETVSVQFFNTIKGSSRSFALRRKVERWKCRLLQHIHPVVGYRFHFLNQNGHGMIGLENGAIFSSPKVAHAFRGCRRMICFIATIGDWLDRKVADLSAKGRLTDAFILDTLGSAAVESTVAQFQSIFRRRCADDGKRVTHRFSPGYCDWPLNEQKKLFHQMDAEILGVSLSDACLMTPRKSVSGIFGILADAKKINAPPYNPCEDCRKTNCPSRRETEL